MALAAPWVSNTFAVMSGHCFAIPWKPGIPATCVHEKKLSVPCPLPSSVSLFALSPILQFQIGLFSSVIYVP